MTTDHDDHGADDAVAALFRQFQNRELTEKGLFAAIGRHLESTGADPSAAAEMMAARGVGQSDAEQPGVVPVVNDNGQTGFGANMSEHQERSPLVDASTPSSAPPNTPAVVNPQRTKTRKVWPWLAAAAVVVVLVVVAVGGVLWFQGKPDRDYLAALRSAGQGGQFPSDAGAIAHAHEVCASLENGSKQQGMAADLTAVQTYCSKFEDGFHVLESKTIDGVFVLTDTSAYGQGISASGSTCTGTGGYSDIGPGTAVLVKDAEGKILTSTTLGSGTGTSTMCTFTFSVDLTEGEDSYVVSVSHRGDLPNTWAELTTSGLVLSLGD